jgi:predicted dehydrogenase
MTDWGAHHNDIARWALGLDGPASVEATHLSEPIPGGYTAYGEYEVNFTWPNGVRQTVKTTRDDSIYGGSVNENGQHNGIRFEGENGWIWVNRGEIEASDDALLHTPLPDGATRLQVSNDHMRNFLDCVRSRQDPIAAVEIGHRSASICHLGAIALRTGRKLNWDAKHEKFTGEGAREDNQWLAREMRKPFDYHFA